jgi:DNA-binding FrmR family transcriptional regulator
VHKDPSAALKLGHARAIALLAAAQAGLEIAEYTPNHIKKCVVGAGHAGKEQVMAMVKRLLPHRARPGRRGRRARLRHRACASVGTRARHRRVARMIGKLTGIVDSLAEDHAIVDVGGVGYLVHCPSSTWRG